MPTHSLFIINLYFQNCQGQDKKIKKIQPNRSFLKIIHAFKIPNGR